MDRVALKNRVGVAQKENESSEAENLIDLTDNQAVCTSESCGSAWKPVPANSDLGDEPD
jgi:hypothetical protein